MKSNFKKGQWILYCNRNAKILEVNLDGTYKVVYWLGIAGKGMSYICNNASEKNFHFDRC